MAEPFIQTASGRCVDFKNPKEDDIDVEEIAHALSLLCRFGGHCQKFYSVAEHSVRCSNLAGQMGLSRELQLEALLHDGSEAYIVDMPRPIKYVLEGYKEIETTFEKIIRKKFGLPLEMSKEVHLIDNTLLATEKRDLMKASERPWHGLPDPIESVIKPWASLKAYHTFMFTFRLLTSD